jgi:hypothetical protein
MRHFERKIGVPSDCEFLRMMEDVLIVPFSALKCGGLITQFGAENGEHSGSRLIFLPTRDGSFPLMLANAYTAGTWAIFLKWKSQRGGRGLNPDA